MSETNNSDKSLRAAPPKTTLHLKRPVEQGTVRQSFSHGRSKAVVVEKVKRRILTPGEAAARGAPGAGLARRSGAGRAAPAKPLLPPPRGPPPPRQPNHRAAAAQDRRRPAHLDGRAARGAQPGSA